MDIKVDNAAAIHLLWLVPILLAVYVYGFYRKRRGLERFATGNLIHHLTRQVSPLRQRIKAALMLGAVACLVLALLGPRWGVHYEDVQHRGIDIVFCLDVSRSMLAEDVSPNRLQRAKQYIQDVVRELHGDRVALVTFAGSGLLQCPLTVDYNMFRMILEEVDVRGSARGGTLIGDAVRLAADSFADNIKKHKAIILVSDGEDQESYPVEAAAQAYTQRGIRIYTVGIGDRDTGTPIPVTINGRRQHLEYQGQTVRSRLTVRELEDMALNGGGAFIPAGTSQVDMGQIYRQKIATADLREFEATRIKRYHVQYQWFAGLAAALLIIEAWISDRRRHVALAVPAMEQAA